MRRLLAGLIAATMCVGVASATERYFTYTYEPEVFTKGASEFEQWVTWLGGRNSAVGQKDYSRFEIREEYEYGVTDNYTAAVYLNGNYTSYRDGRDFSRLQWDGISVENRYMILNPANSLVGLTLYLEPRVSDRQIEVEEKIIIGQRFAENWKWAANFVHATEWSLKNEGTEGEVELDFGIARELGKRWAVGIELRNHNEIPEYNQWENTALYLGPVVSYRTERWWAAFSVMPQIFGKNFSGNEDRVANLDLEGHERINIRLVAGITF